MYSTFAFTVDRTCVLLVSLEYYVTLSGTVPAICLFIMSLITLLPSYDVSIPIGLDKIDSNLLTSVNNCGNFFNGSTWSSWVGP